MVKPITPEEVENQKAGHWHPQIIKTINKLIVEHWNGHSASISQDVVARRIASAMNVSDEVVFNNRWLDFEPIFEQVGWEVRYDKPGWNETGKPFFHFSKK